MAGKAFIFSTNELNKNLKELAKQFPQKAEKAMTDVKNLLVRETKKRTPVDEGPLTASITGGVEQHGKSFAATVYVPVNAPGAAYAVRRHEETYELGENSQKKQAKTGVAVGQKYITRAFDDNKQKIVMTIKAVLKV